MSHVAVHIQTYWRLLVHSKHGCGRVDALLVLSVAFISVFRASVAIKLRMVDANIRSRMLRLRRVLEWNVTFHVKCNKQN